MFGRLQIKGVGRNSLAAKDTDFFHSYGGASLNESVLEAIWGEVCTCALPFGAARTVGIVGTGTRVPLRYPKSGQDSTTPRALVVREFKLRPAHFMRAVYSARDIPGIVCSDAERTRQALLRLGGIGEKLGLLSARVKCSAPILATLDGMLQRAAIQIATARAKRIMHGSLTGSNMALDGGWIDFGSISAVSDYGRVIIPRGAPDFLHEHNLLLQEMRELYFYVWKYVPGLSVEQIKAAEAHAIQRFAATLQTELAYRICELTGIPRCLLDDMDRRCVQEFSTVALRIAEAGNDRAFRILHEDNDRDPVMPDKMGHYHLPSILTCLAGGIEVTDSDELASLLPDDRLRAKLVGHYRVLMRRAEEAGAGRYVTLFFRLNSIRKNIETSVLYRTNLYPAINQLIAGAGDCRKFIQEVVADAKAVLTDDLGEDVPLPSPDSSLPVRMTGAAQIFQGNQMLTLAEYLASFGGRRIGLGSISAFEKLRRNAEL